MANFPNNPYRRSHPPKDQRPYQGFTAFPRKYGPSGYGQMANYETRPGRIGAQFGNEDYQGGYMVRSDLMSAARAAAEMQAQLDALPPGAPLPEWWTSSLAVASSKLRGLNDAMKNYASGAFGKAQYGQFVDRRAIHDPQPTNPTGPGVRGLPPPANQMRDMSRYRFGVKVFGR